MPTENDEVTSSSSQDSSSQGVSTVPSSIQEGQSNIGQIDAALIQRAITPIPGAHVGQMPSAFTTPIQPFQPLQQNTNKVIGRRAAKMQGIGNTITGVANALGQVTTQIAQQKQGQVRDAATKVLTAQQGIDEAKQALDAAHAANDSAAAAKAQEMLDKNTQARDAIFADPKMRKMLVKGFDISYTDPQSNKTDEHKGVMDAVKNAKTMQEKKRLLQEAQEQQNQVAGKAAGSAFEKSLPQTLTSNTLAQQQLQTQLSLQKSITDARKAGMPLEVERLRAEAQLQAKQMEISNRNYQRQQSFQQRQQLIGLSNAFATKRLYLEANLALQKEKALINMKNTDPDLLFKEANKAANAWDARQEAAQSRLEKAESDLATLSGKSVDDPDYKRASALVDQATSDMEMVQDQADYSLDSFNIALAKVGKEPIPGPKLSQDKTGDVNASSSATSPGTGNSFYDYTDVGDGAGSSTIQ